MLGCMILMSAKGISLSGFIERVLSAWAAVTIRSAILCFTVYELQSCAATSERMMDCGDVKREDSKRAKAVLLAV